MFEQPQVPSPRQHESWVPGKHGMVRPQVGTSQVVATPPSTAPPSAVHSPAEHVRPVLEQSTHAAPETPQVAADSPPAQNPLAWQQPPHVIGPHASVVASGFPESNPPSVPPSAAVSGATSWVASRAASSAASAAGAASLPAASAPGSMDVPPL
jgi:hypothetical protein